MASRRPRRLLLLSGFLLVLFPLVLFHRICLLIDRILFPGFDRIEPRWPLFVAGVPRGGTTLLHRLMAADNQFTTMPLWEAVLAPALVQKYVMRGCCRVDRLLGRPLFRLTSVLEKRLLGGFGSIHATSLWLPEEDYLTLIPIAACFILIQPFPFKELWSLARIDRALDERQRRRLMHFYRGIIQRHLYFRGKNRIYLSKNPTFTGAIESLREAFPECRLVAMVREPVATAGSLINSMYVGASSFHNQIDHGLLRDPLLNLLEEYFRIAVQLRQVSPPHSVVLRLDDLTNRPAAALSDLYDCLGYKKSADFDEFAKQLTAKVPQYRSTHRYDLRQFELQPARVAERFSFATDVFGWNRAEA